MKKTINAATESVASNSSLTPAHYASMEVQPWDVMEVVMDRHEFRGYLKGNIIKYSMRAGKKEGSDDWKKAAHYIMKLKELDEEY